MMSKFEKVLYWYRAGMWDIKKVRNAVVKKWITEEEFKEITGEEY
jgi:hypothetical protein